MENVLFTYQSKNLSISQKTEFEAFWSIFVMLGFYLGMICMGVIRFS